MRKLNKIQRFAVALVAVAALAVPVALAQGGGKGEGHGQWGHRGGERGEMGLMGFRQLNLTDAQKAQLKQIHENHKQAIAPLMQQIAAKRQEIRAASESGTVDEAAATQKLTEIAPLEAKLMAEHAKIRQESLAVLTPEQKTQLDTIRAQAKARWAERRANKPPKTQ